MERIAPPDAAIFAPRTQRRGFAGRWARRLLVAAAVVVVLAALVPRATTWVLARGDVAHRPSDIPRLSGDERRAGIVLGAGVVDDRPSPVLAARIDAGVELLDDERIDLLLMSGDNSTPYYDEPTAMRERAIERGAPSSMVAADYAGRRTWDTCTRARRVFGIREAVVITSDFHVDRAVATCRAAGIDTIGYSVDTDRPPFSPGSRARWRIRELPATGRALLDAWVLRPDPAVGGERIDPYDPCELRRSLAPSDAADEFQCE